MLINGVSVNNVLEDEKLLNSLFIYDALENKLVCLPIQVGSRYLPYLQILG